MEPGLVVVALDLAGRLDDQRQAVGVYQGNRRVQDKIAAETRPLAPGAVRPARLRLAVVKGGNPAQDPNPGDPRICCQRPKCVLNE